MSKQLCKKTDVKEILFGPDDEIPTQLWEHAHRRASRTSVQEDKPAHGRCFYQKSFYFICIKIMLSFLVRLVWTFNVLESW